MALVITRHLGESFTITDENTGDTAEITLSYKGGKEVRLVIDAPPHWAIRRDDMINPNPNPNQKAGVRQ